MFKHSNHIYHLLYRKFLSVMRDSMQKWEEYEKFRGKFMIRCMKYYYLVKKDIVAYTKMNTQNKWELQMYYKIQIQYVAEKIDEMIR